MNWPNELDALVEGDDDVVKAKKIGYQARYDACEYKDSSGRCFFIDTKYAKECLENKKPVHVPIQVVTQLENMREKLAWGQAQLKREARQKQSGLILPPDTIKPPNGLPS